MEKEWNNYLEVTDMKNRMVTIVIVFVAIMLCACGKEEAGDKVFPVIRIMTMGTEPACGMQVIYDKLDPMTEAELGLDVRVSFYKWEDEAKLMKKLVNSDSFDIYVYGAPFDSGTLSEKKAFLDAKDYLDIIPDLVAFYKAQGVDLEKSEHVYSFPRLNSSSSYGFLYREDLRKKWGLDEIADFESVEAYLYRAKEEYPCVAPINDKRFFSSLMGLYAGKKYCYLGMNLVVEWDNPKQVKCIMDTPEYMEMLEIAQKWYRDGIVSGDVLYLQNNNTFFTVEMMKQDKAALEFCNHFAAVCSNYAEQLYEVNPEWELGWLNYESMNGVCFQNIATSKDTIGLAISNNCIYPEQALLLLEKMHVDSRYYNLFTYGVEGINYNVSEKGTINYQGIDAKNMLRGQIGLECDCMMLPMEYSGNWNEVYKKTTEEIEAVSKENGASWSKEFQLSTEEYGEWQNAMNEYTNSSIRAILETGVSQEIEKDLAQFREQLTEAGYDRFMEEVQKKLDLYWEKQD